MTNFCNQPLFQVKADSGDELRFFYEAVLPGLRKHDIRAAVIIRDKGLPTVTGDASTLYISMGRREEFSLLPDLFRHADMVFIVDRLPAEDNTLQSSPFIVADFQGDSSLAMKYLLEIADSLIQEREIWACVLIGGKSSRMGEPKHLLSHKGGQTWLERNIGLVKEKVAGIAISGGGELPADLLHYPRVQDIPGVQGPLTGLISATRWMPDVSWLVCACDLPAVTVEAIDWLLSDRRPGCWAKIPRLNGQQSGEPLLARYEPQCGPLFEAMGRSGSFSLHRIFSNDKVDLVEVPAGLEESWRNVNTPTELQDFEGE